MKVSRISAKDLKAAMLASFRPDSMDYIESNELDDHHKSFIDSKSEYRSSIGFHLCKGEGAFTLASNHEFPLNEVMMADIILGCFGKNNELQGALLADVGPRSVHISFICSKVGGGESLLLSWVDNYAVVRKKEIIFLDAVQKDVKFYLKKGYRRKSAETWPQYLFSSWIRMVKKVSQGTRRRQGTTLHNPRSSRHARSSSPHRSTQSPRP
jgi:hypothetical protein